MKLTKNEEWIIVYLKGKDYVSPTTIGECHADTFGFNPFTHHSAWASPICLRLVKKGLLLRNKKGQYKLNGDETVKVKGRLLGEFFEYKGSTYQVRTTKVANRCSMCHATPCKEERYNTLVKYFGPCSGEERNDGINVIFRKVR